MRTKALLLTAILGVTGVVSTLAQSNVYSVNVVGYVTVTVTNDVNYRILANPLISTNNALASLVPTAPDGTQVTWLDDSGVYQTAGYESLFGGWDKDPNLPIGKGFFVRLGAATPVTITFVGEVAQDAASNKQIPSGLSLQGALVPQKGGFQAVHNVPGVDGAQLSVLPPNGVYETAGYESLFGGWDKELTIDVAEGFFYMNPSAPLAWDRNFKVN